MPESSFIRDVYVYYQHVGVQNDGLAEGIEHTRIKQARPPWESEQPASKQRAKQPVDRYGFFDTMAKQGNSLVLPASLYVKRGWHLRPHARSPVLSSKKKTAARSVPQVLKKDHRLLPLDETRELRRTHKWIAMMENEDEDEDEENGEQAQFGQQPEDTKSVKHQLREDLDVSRLHRRVYKGIPDEMRGQVWFALSRDEETRPYPSLAELMELDSEHDVQIDLDVPRTMRYHERFYTRYGEGQCTLFTVLHSMSLICKECGYCQGMGPTAAMLLLHMPTADALEMMVRLHDVYGFHDVYRHGFPGLRAEFYVLQALLKHCCPRAAKELERHGLAPSAYATGWLMTLFHNVLPYHTQLRVWDAFFLHGFDVLLIVATALIRSLDAQLSRSTSSFDLHEVLSASMVPESDDALLMWVHRAIQDPKIKSIIGDHRRTWSRMEQEGSHTTYFV